MLKDYTKAGILSFDGSDLNTKRDGERLTNQYLVIFDLMKDGKWRTMGEIEDITGYPQASISAQLRHSRKTRFGSHTVEKQYISNGLYQYRLIVNVKKQPKLF